MFGTSGVRGPVGETVTVDLAAAIGGALAVDTDTIVLGRDARASGPMLADALAAGARLGGTTVLDCGQVATPTLARAVGWQDADAGVMITASHNPPPDNGIKLFEPSGRAFGPDAQAKIETRLESGTAPTAEPGAYGARHRLQGAAEHHIEAITEAVADAPPLQVVVDVGTGMGAITADVLRRLGHTVETLNEGPDGQFPARPSEPTAATTTTLQAVVAGTDAALGVAHDGDADRLCAVDERGRFVPGDLLLAVFALSSAEAGDRVVAPVNTSLAVEEALAARDITVRQSKVGDVHVAAQVAAEEAAVFGGEPSGTWIWPAATLAPDGPLAAAKLVAHCAHTGSLATAVDTIETGHLLRESHEVTDKAAVMDRVHDRLTERVTGDQLTTIDGLKVDTDDGWLLVRPSGTEPLVRLTAEAHTEARAEALLAWGRELVGAA